MARKLKLDDTNTATWLMDMFTAEERAEAALRGRVLYFLQDFRSAKGLSRSELAAMLETSVEHVEDLENCEGDLSLDDLLKISVVSGTSIGNIAS